MPEKIGGYTGRMLYLDLGKKEFDIEPLNRELIENFTGGYSINLKLAMDLIPPRVAPFSSENKIVLGAGPFNGTFIPGGAKTHATTVSPLNGSFIRASGGGALGAMLKSCGYDHLVISGKSSDPIYLKIQKNGVKFCEAHTLWGKDIYETVDTLKHAHNPCSVLPIGPARENLVNISLCCIDKFSTLGRGGLAAVMGSKNLKAIVVCRDSYRIKAASPQDLSALVNGLQERMIKWSGRDLVLRYGVGYEAVKETVEGPNIYNNWTCASTPSEEEVGKKYPFLQMYENNRKTLSCPSCLLADKEVVQAVPGGPVFYGDHLAAVDVDKDCFHRAVEYSAYLNRLGLDRFDFASLVSLVAVLYREGLVNLKDTEGKRQITPTLTFKTGE